MKHNSLRLQDKIAVVSGGTSGIGLAIAQRFVREGAYVFIFGRRQEALDAAKTSIGSNVTGIQADASVLHDIDRVVDIYIRQRARSISLWRAPAEPNKCRYPRFTPEHFDYIFDLNARGPVFLVQRLLPMMGRGGSIILVSSAMHYMGLANHTAYAATKAALRSFCRTWAAEFKGNGIRANTLSPGVVDTPMLADQGSSPDKPTTPEEASAIRQSYINYTPMLRLGLPDELANAALFLASDESSFMTGSDMVVDGGVSNV